ncbi:NAD synthetase [Aquipluma nitroreducens]|uniref:NH(3)-dependent NAD(+) synthetase n=2 Tax=Aquipluma nitroreducens TaxID=2010828 RepID=A0A5K7SGE4_9BACT|nr:NAD synthetase [Aquipluma nitroreducens]
MEPRITIPFSKDILKFENVEAEADRISRRLKDDILVVLKRKGAVIGISGGIDSSVTLALTVKAIGSENVIGIMLPEKDSSPESKEFALKLAGKLNIKTLEEEITRALDGFGCYRRRDEAVTAIFPEYNPNDFKMKIGINQSGLNQFLPPVFSLTIIGSDGKAKSKILPIKEYLQIVAASNFKQRCRMSMLYYHAERLHFAMIGTPNKHEVEQGFFVKNGDGGADIMPIAHLYKSQVYQLAEHLGIPEEIIKRTPTSDTYSAEQTQEEFFFQMPYLEMDLIWYGLENGVPEEEVGKVLGKTKEEIRHIYNNLIRKKKTTEYLRMAPITY